MVGYPVAVEKADNAFNAKFSQHQHIPKDGEPNCSTKAKPGFTSTVNSTDANGEPETLSSAAVNEDDGRDTFNPAEEVKIKERLQRRKDHRPSFTDMHGDDPARRPSINVYQSIDDDHPDLQSIQNLVANMTFGADLD